MPEEVLVISLGTGPQTVPGMMSENEVMWLELMYSFAGQMMVKFNVVFSPVTEGEQDLKSVSCILLCMQCLATD